MRILTKVSYNGTNYVGWQKQPNGLSVQEVIEKELSKFFNREVVIYGSGRTDAGVHAFEQTFHFDIDEDEIDLSRLIYSLNKMLPLDIKIIDMEVVDDDFHARYSAKGKIYAYTILLESKDVFLYQTTYVCPYELDVDMMDEALQHFKGVHNFKNFTSKEEDKDNFVRDIYEISFTNTDGFITILFSGNGFMRYMIRYIVGTVIEVARGRLTFEDIDNLLDEDSPREIVSYKAPACGLCLMEVKY